MNKRPYCKGCTYYRILYSSDKGCHYMLLNGEERGCSVEECGKKKIRYKTKTKNKAEKVGIWYGKQGSSRNT